MKAKLLLLALFLGPAACERPQQAPTVGSEPAPAQASVERPQTRVSAGVSGQIYQSAFGFTTEISDNWLVVSRQALSQNPDMLNFEASEMQTMDPEMIARIRQMVTSGRFELLYYRHNDPDFKDNINLFVSNPRRSDIAAAEQPLCSSLQSDLQNAYQRSEYTEVYGCERKSLHGVDSISYAFDGAVIGSRSYGFLFNSGSGSVTMTITCKLSKCEEIFPEAETLFRNMRF